MLAGAVVALTVTVGIGAACSSPQQGNPQVVPATSVIRPELQPGGIQPTRPPLSPAVPASPSPRAASSPLPVASPSPSPSPAIHPIIPGFNVAPSPTSGR